MTKSSKPDGDTGFGESHGLMSRTRALTARVACWQSRRCGVPIVASVFAAGLLVMGPVSARTKGVPSVLDGPIDTLHRGDYLCELAGNALGEAGVHQPAEDFAILHDSVYRNASGQGSYLLTGKLIQMTSGPKRGERYRRLSDSFLRRLAPDGTETTLRCVRVVLNNQR
jgi:hypothetical protein